jgi:hypothetical protein
MEYIKKNFLTLLIVILLFIIFIQDVKRSKIVEKPTIKRDTVWVQKDSVIYSRPLITKTILPTIIEKHYIADTNKVKLTEQYNELVKLYLSKNIHNEKIKIDSLGYVDITDTVSKNLIQGRKISYDLKYPIVTNTVTLSPLRNNQLYYGGGIELNPSQLINQFNAGLLLKTKSDHIYSVYGGIKTDGQFQIGLQSYWKISFKK